MKHSHDIVAVYNCVGSFRCLYLSSSFGYSATRRTLTLEFSMYQETCMIDSYVALKWFGLIMRTNHQCRRTAKSAATELSRALVYLINFQAITSY